MLGFTIGAIARRMGMRASAIRYYQREGLIPKAARKSGRRVYDAYVFDHLHFVRLALRSGFRIAEVKLMVRGLTPATKPGERWRTYAKAKLAELDRDIEILEARKRLLVSLTKCQCPSVSHFVKTRMSSACGIAPGT